MFHKKIIMFLVLTLGCYQKLSALTIINQTDTEWKIEIDEAYQPDSASLDNFEEPVSLGFPKKKLKVSPHSKESVKLSSNPKVLLFSISSKTKKKKKSGTSITTFTTTMIYEPYNYEDQSYETFTDDWGFIIHQPIEKEFLPKTDFFFGYNFKERDLERDQENGFGIKCLHPLILNQMTSLDQLSDDQKRLLLE